MALEKYVVLMSTLSLLGGCGYAVKKSPKKVSQKTKKLQRTIKKNKRVIQNQKRQIMALRDQLSELSERNNKKSSEKNLIVSGEKSEGDFVLAQKAFSLGGEGRLVELSHLKKLLKKGYPKSVLTPMALFDMALSHFQEKDYPKALELFEEVYGSYPQTLSGLRALFYMGKVKRIQGDKRASRNYFKKVFSQYPGSKEAELSVGYLKNEILRKNSKQGTL